MGHRMRKSGLQSQNLEQLRTEKAEIGGSESEPGSTSDRESRNWRFRVRTWSNFGRGKWKLAVQSQNLE
ncbi:hypothetical protein BK139_14420 [Paenibacillus sp. FSL R5-0490]|nr:hypothetical protein BK139_14420 [Paenibacillus sp. FSL R5-0490]